MRPLRRAERLAVALWIVVALAAGNGVYDILITRGVKDYLFRYALGEAGRGPTPPLVPYMHAVVVDATWIGLLWGSVILLAGMGTVRLLRSR